MTIRPTADPTTGADPVTFRIRPLRRDETGALDELVHRLSPRSRYLRFHAPLAALSSRMRRSLADVDGHRRVALLAEDRDGTVLGIVRYIRDDHEPCDAEVALAVADAHQHAGVGRQLVTAISRHAAAAGITRLHARVLAENEAALGLFRAAFPVMLVSRHDQLVQLTCPLGNDWEITMDDIYAGLLGT